MADRGAEAEFDEAYFTRLAAAGGHWWVQGMGRAAEAMLGPVRAGRALDAGCGSGTGLAWLGRLAPGARLHGADVAAEGLAAARRHATAATITRASVVDLPYRSASFDLVACLDVLQHLPDGLAARAVAEVARVLAPGGQVVLRTNAAFGRAQVAERAGWHLFAPGELGALLDSAGLTIDRLTHVNALGGLVASGRARLGRRPAPGAHESEVHGLGLPPATGALRNRVLGGLLTLEARVLGRGVDLPFGHSLLAVATKPSPAGG